MQEFTLLDKSKSPYRKDWTLSKVMRELPVPSIEPFGHYYEFDRYETIPRPLKHTRDWK